MTPTPLQVLHIMPMLSATATATWPRTAAEAKEWCRARNEESRRERERKDAEHRRWMAEHAQLSRDLQVELDRRQRARSAAPEARTATRPVIDWATIYARLNFPRPQGGRR